MLLKNVKVLRPKTTKIQKRNGIGYVYQVIGKSYKKDKKYTVENRKLIGKMIDEEWMIPNEYFEQYYPDVCVEQETPEFSDTLRIGCFLVVQKIFRDLQIEDVLLSIFGDLGCFIEDIVSYMITNESCTFQYYSNFMRNHPVMDKNIRDDTQISRLLKYNIKEQDINLFLRAWNQMNNTKECIYVGYDSTNFNTNAYGIELADYGHPKVDEGLPQYNLAYAVNQKDSTPLFYELYDGSVIDNTELEIMLEEAKEYGHEKLGVLMDRGYISEKNIKALRTKGYEYILMMKQNQRICQEIIEEYGAAVQSLEGYYIGEHGVYGTTVKKQLYGQETNIHVYYDDIRASEEKVALMSRYETWEKEIEKKVSKKIATEGEIKKYRKVFKLKYDQNGYLVAYQRNSRYIKEEIRNLGFFFIITSEEMSASKALDIYRGRDNIEKMFRSLKSGIDFNKARVHTTESLKSKVFVTFIAMIVRNELFQKAEELRKKNRKAYTVPGMISELENIECTRNSVGRYRRKYALTEKQKLILKQFDMDENILTEALVNSATNASFIFSYTNSAKLRFYIFFKRYVLCISFFY